MEIMSLVIAAEISFIASLSKGFSLHTFHTRFAAKEAGLEKMLPDVKIRDYNLK